MSVNEEKAKYLEAKKAVASCQSSIAELQRKSDDLQDSLPGLSRAVEEAEKTKVAALDDFALNSNKTTEQALRAARQAHEAAQRTCGESNELLEAIVRTLKKQEQALVRLNNLCDLAKRQCWESIAGEIRLGIPESVVADIQHLVVASMQCSKTKQFILSGLLPNLNPSEYQAIRDEMSAQYEIDD